MIRLLSILILAFLCLEANSSIDAKIKSTSSKINYYIKNYENINRKMAQNARAILRQKREIQKQQVYLKNLKKELLDKEKSHKENIALLEKLKKHQSKLKKDGNKLEEELAFTIAQSVSLSIILEEEYSASEDSIIEFEVLRLMLKNSKAKIKELNSKFYKNAKTIESISAQTKSLEAAIASIDAKRKDLINTQEKNKKDLKKLEIAKSLYKKELKKVLRKQDLLKRTLSKLNIIKIDKIKKAKEEARRSRAFDAKTIISAKDLPKVKKHGSSYQAAKTKKYTGPKTIAPFEPYKITKKYGKYTDPIYGIKVFNESISLKPKRKNTKV